VQVRLRIRDTSFTLRHPVTLYSLDKTKLGRKHGDRVGQEKMENVKVQAKHGFFKGINTFSRATFGQIMWESGFIYWKRFPYFSSSFSHSKRIFGLLILKICKILGIVH
jgi:hypothetical protein